MTPLKVSSRIDQATSTPPATISRNRKRLSTAENKSAPQVTSCAPRSPIARPKKPAIIAASSGRKTTATPTASALHHVDVFDSNGAAVAEVDDEDRETDCRFRRRDRQNEHCKGLADEVAQKDREGDEIDTDRKQHQFDRHQHDDNVFAIEKDAKNTQCEQDRGNRQ